MCGIVGFISDNKEYDDIKIVNKMLDAIQHRGPDQRGLKKINNTTIGMVRLSIISETKHEIPFHDNSGNYFIVYNGELYNHENLKTNLSSRYEFSTSSDVETVMNSYIDNGIKSFYDFNGMYAFAIHDSFKKKTIIVRDKTGEKPLYYAFGKDYFIFSSEIKAILTFIKPEFNNDALSYQAYEFTVGKETLFKNIYALEPGEYIEIKDGQHRIEDYWKIWNNYIELPDSEKKIIKMLTELIEDSIILRTKNCAHKYAAFVSGGIDSSLVACIAKPDILFSAHYDFADFDELEYAKLVAKKIKKELIVVRPEKDDFIETQDSIAFHLDTPCTWTSFSLWMLMKKVKSMGYKVIMTGDGADEVFGGYHRYHILNHDEQINNLEAMKNYKYLISRYYGSPVERYTKLVNRSENQFDEKVIQYLHESIGFYHEKCNNDLIHFMGMNDFYSTMQVLLQMSDRMSMAFSIENRSPFLDHRIVQFAFSMSSKYKIRDGITKWLLKKVAEKFIPKEIVKRTDKRGFSAPVNYWFEWDKKGKYNRSSYRNLVLDDWKRIFSIKN